MLILIILCTDAEYNEGGNNRRRVKNDQSLERLPTDQCQLFPQNMHINANS